MNAVAVAHQHRWFGEAEMTGELACADCGKTIGQYGREYDEMVTFVARVAAIDLDSIDSNDEEHDQLVDAIDEAQSIEAKS